jgi:predicted TIM-barrel fold metal-dependent hydrolase
MHSLPPVIVDAHHHLWQLADGRYPWLQEGYDPAAFFLGDYSALRQDFGPRDYRLRTEGLAIKATVHVEAERHRAESLAETAWLHQVNVAHGFPNAVVAHVEFGAIDADEQMREQVAWPLVRGVRCKPVTGKHPDISIRGAPGTLQDPAWLSGLELLVKHGLSWDLRVPFWHLEEAADAAAQFPALAIVLEHAGLPWDRSPAGLGVWRKGMQALAKLPNVHVKLSEFGQPGAPWDTQSNATVVRETVAIFGWQRCMFASNLPVSGLRVSMAELVRTVGLGLSGLDDSAKQAVWGTNAMRFYRI